MASHWSHLLTRAEIDAQRATAAALDPAYARRDAEWWDSRTDAQLRAARVGAWDCNEGGTFQMASSLLALRGAAAPSPYGAP